MPSSPVRLARSGQRCICVTGATDAAPWPPAPGRATSTRGSTAGGCRSREVASRGRSQRRRRGSTARCRASKSLMWRCCENGTMPEHVRCNLCGGDSPKFLYRARDYRLRTDDVVWSVVRCAVCGLGYLDPQPTPDEIHRYYPPEYFDRSDAAARERYEREAKYLPSRPGRLLDIGTADGGFLTVMSERGWQ